MSNLPMECFLRSRRDDVEELRAIVSAEYLPHMSTLIG